MKVSKIIAVALLTSCAHAPPEAQDEAEPERGSVEASTARIGSIPAPTVQPPVHAAIHGSLAVWLEVPDTVRAGEAVPLQMFMQNVGRDSVGIRVGGGGYQGRVIISFDYAVRTLDGREIWRRTHRAPPLTGAPLLAFAPGEIKELAFTWDQLDNQRRPVPSGVYMVHGFPDGTSPGQWQPSPRRIVVRAP